MSDERDFTEVERFFLLGRGLLQRCVPRLLHGELRSDVGSYLFDSQRRAGLVASGKAVLRLHDAMPTGPQSCVNCAQHSFERFVRKEEYRYAHHCEHPILRDVVTGLHTPCDANRRNEAKCGLEARYFTPKIANESIRATERNESTSEG